jgi:hypothetical protein
MCWSAGAGSQMRMMGSGTAHACPETRLRHPRPRPPTRGQGRTDGRWLAYRPCRSREDGQVYYSARPCLACVSMPLTVDDRLILGVSLGVPSTARVLPCPRSALAPAPALTPPVQPLHPLHPLNPSSPLSDRLAPLPSGSTSDDTLRREPIWGHLISRPSFLSDRITSLPPPTQWLRCRLCLGTKAHVHVFRRHSRSFIADLAIPFSSLIS